MIDIKAVDIVKAGTTLLKNFSWQIKPGENWIITGPNGSGKTLLLEAIAGLSHTPRGEIQIDFINGQSWDERYAEKKRLITYIPAYALPMFVNHHDLFYQQRYYASGDDHMTTRVKEVLGDGFIKLDELDIPASLSVTHLLEVEIARLSNGQLKKLLLVKSLLKGIPKLLLLDYPFEGLDYTSRENFSDFIDFVSQRHGVQVILVDQQNIIPACINRKLTLNKFQIERTEVLSRLPRRHSGPQPFLSSSHSKEGAEEVIRINNLSVAYGNHQIIKNFNWLVTKGDRWAVTGRNGAGKTTLFSLIFADHPQAYAQEIYLFGKRRGSGESIWDIKRRINYLGPEQITFLDSNKVMMTVKDYIKHSTPRFSRDLLMRLLQHFDADRLMDKRVGTLSSGELQLIMIVSCFLSENELWLLDEPFQFLDPAQKARLKDYLSAHLKPEITLILITHNDDDLDAWTDRKMQL